MKKKRNFEDDYWALLRADFRGFIERSFYELEPDKKFLSNWHIDVLAYELEKVRFGDTTRFILNLPPRSLKSHCASVAFPAWLLGHNPSCQIICVSYGRDLALKLASDCRRLMSSQMYKRLFPTRLLSERPPLNELTTTKGGFRLATSIGGVLTGRGADFIIIDDPLKADDAASDCEREATNDWYDNTLVSRLNNKRQGRIVIVMQRLHEHDLVGHALGKDDWRLLRLPAIADVTETYTIRTPLGDERHYTRHEGEVLHPEHEDRATLDKLAGIKGTYNFSAQYQQAPTPLAGGMIKESWFRTYTLQNRPEKWDFVLQSWDTAAKTTELADFSVCTTWGLRKKDIYLLHVFRKRVDYPTLKRAVRDQALLWGATSILIEDRSSGTQLIQELLYEGMYGVVRYALPPGQDKIMRMHSCTSTIENGFVYLPEEADWLADYRHEIKTFPNGRYDDQADSTSQALHWLKQRYLCQNVVTFSQILI